MSKKRSGRGRGRMQRLVKQQQRENRQLMSGLEKLARMTDDEARAWLKRNGSPAPKFRWERKDP